MKLDYRAFGLALLVCSASANTAAGATTEEQNSAEAQPQAGAQPAMTELSAATGVDYSAGHYGAASDTTVWNIPLDIKAQLGRVRLQASLPYTFIKGPGHLVGGVVVADPSGKVTARSGVGDLNLSAAYMLVREQGALPTIELSGSVKLPTAKSSIGTGKTDYALSASVYKSLTSNVMLFGSLGYSWLTSPAAYRLENGITASGGINFRPAQNQNYGVSIAYREPVAIGLRGQAVVSPYMTYRVSKLWGLTLYGLAGLNDASPRIGAGLRLTIFG
ncbi:transporter [Sphingomonas lycopersici]|uniref:Transporter n=1 Tax=Sphingomonas lycopersici TaxID=2951807 RepID=A0AA41ZBR4_9SPHN|nr:transporter [Sphingomonas lycopersici]MCW6537630.1 transporter [Sphingomonas lycopersici]